MCYALLEYTPMYSYGWNPCHSYWFTWLQNPRNKTKQAHTHTPDSLHPEDSPLEYWAAWTDILTAFFSFFMFPHGKHDSFSGLLFPSWLFYLPLFLYVKSLDCCPSRLGRCSLSNSTFAICLITRSLLHLLPSLSNPHHYTFRLFRKF